MSTLSNFWHRGIAPVSVTGFAVGGTWQLSGNAPVLHFAIYGATQTGSGTVTSYSSDGQYVFPAGGDPQITYSYTIASNRHTITFKYGDSTIGTWQV